MKPEKIKYNYFYHALKKHVKIFGWGVQAFLSSATGLSDGYLSMVINGKKQAGFRSQVAIAKAFEVEYEEFLLQGRELVIDEENQTNPKINEDEIRKKHIKVKVLPTDKPIKKPNRLKLITNGDTHEDIIRQFKDKKTARVLNKMLMEIEKTDPDQYQTIQTIIKTVHKSIIQKKTTKTGSK